MNRTKITAYETKTRQAEIFRRAAAGETFVVTNNSKPQVEIRQVLPAQVDIAKAIKALTALQKRQRNKGGSQSALKAMLDAGRD
ncbi:MAG: hypothetical protein V3T17_15260 [Pseudomonadales bacterium]